jgi:hypothetical protein
MHLLSRARTHVSITGLSIAFGLLALTSGAPPSFAAELAVPTTPAHQALGAGTSTSIIMRDGGVCDPIRHMGC